MTDIPTITWAVVTVQDSDGKVSVLEIPVGNNIEINYGQDVTRQQLKVMIEATVGNPRVPLVVLRGHG